MLRSRAWLLHCAVQERTTQKQEQLRFPLAVGDHSMMMMPPCLLSQVAFERWMGGGDTR